VEFCGQGFIFISTFLKNKSLLSKGFLKTFLRKAIERKSMGRVVGHIPPLKKKEDNIYY